MTIEEASTGSVQESADGDGRAPDAPEAFREQDEAYVRYMETWLDEEETTEDLAPLWSFAVPDRVP